MITTVNFPGPAEVRVDCPTQASSESLADAILDLPRLQRCETTLGAVTAQRDELLHSLKTLFCWIEDGTLVRDISKDAEPKFALRMMTFVHELGMAKAAIDKAEAAK